MKPDSSQQSKQLLKIQSEKDKGKARKEGGKERKEKKKTVKMKYKK